MDQKQFEKLTNAKKLNELHRVLKDLSARVGALESRSEKVFAEVGGERCPSRKHYRCAARESIEADIGA
jgi:hypothetical protein